MLTFRVSARRSQDRNPRSSSKFSSKIRALWFQISIDSWKRKTLDPWLPSRADGGIKITRDRLNRQPRGERALCEIRDRETHSSPPRRGGGGRKGSLHNYARDKKDRRASLSNCPVIVNASRGEGEREIESARVQHRLISRLESVALSALARATLRRSRCRRCAGCETGAALLHRKDKHRGLNSISLGNYYSVYSTAELCAGSRTCARTRAFSIGRGNR